MTVRKIGVEEELLLVDPETREPAAVSHRVLAGHQTLEDKRAKESRRTDADRDQAGDGGPGIGQFGEEEHIARTPMVEQEIFLQQLETATAPSSSMAEVELSLRRCRAVAAEAASTVGAVTVAVGVPVMGEASAVVTPNDRYQRIIDEFGSLIRDVVVSGMHVHVDIADDEEGVGVIDRVRPWLPVLLALSANSPLRMAPTPDLRPGDPRCGEGGPAPGRLSRMVTQRGYHAVAEAMIASGASMDKGMLYYDIRLAESWPTVEFRVADVCTEVDDALLIAALSRALVETAAGSWRAQEDAPAWRTDLLRAAQWRAARYGVAGRLMHPKTCDLQPARLVVEGLMTHAADALAEAEDTELVTDGLERLLARGAGASRQRAVAEAQSSLDGCRRRPRRSNQRSSARLKNPPPRRSGANGAS
ncbi:MAG: glutamate--cysteine ligase [Nocardioidaceae bacterium]